MAIRLGVGLAVLGVLAVAVPASASDPARLDTHPLGGRDPGRVLETLAPLLKPETRVSHVEGALVVLADTDDHEVVRQILAGLDAPARAQYEITIVHGASRAEAQSLIEGVAVSNASRSARIGAQTSSLRVIEGERARVESGLVVQAVDAVLLGRRGHRYGGFFGTTRSERVLTRGFEVRVMQRDELVELEIAPFTLRREEESSDEQVSALATRIAVPPGQWTEIGGGVTPGRTGARTYASRARADESLVLLRVDPIAP